jgi:hypothetical protein
MRYIMFVCVDPEHTAEDAAAAPDIDDWLVQVEPNRVIGDRLRPPAEARTVRVRGGERLVTDGPYTESKEWIAGFDVLECDTIEQALDLAAAHPMAYSGRIEVRAFWPGDDDTGAEA